MRPRRRPRARRRPPDHRRPDHGCRGEPARVPGVQDRDGRGDRLSRPGPLGHDRRLGRDVERLPPADRLQARQRAGRREARPVPRTALPRISHERRIYRLTLREGLRYSNGTRVKASDFKRRSSGTSCSTRPALPSSGTSSARTPSRGTRRAGSAASSSTTRPARSSSTSRSREADFSNVLASEFAAPVPASAPRADTTLNPLPATGPYEIKSYPPKSRIVEERNPHFQAWRFHGSVPAGNPDRVTWDIVPTAGAALHAVLTGKDDWMSYWPDPEQTARRPSRSGTRSRSASSRRRTSRTSS